MWRRGHRAVHDFLDSMASRLLKTAFDFITLTQPQGVVGKANTIEEAHAAVKASGSGSRCRAGNPPGRPSRPADDRRGSQARERLDAASTKPRQALPPRGTCSRISGTRLPKASWPPRREPRIYPSCHPSADGAGHGLGNSLSRDAQSFADQAGRVRDWSHASVEDS